MKKNDHYIKMIHYYIPWYNINKYHTKENVLSQNRK